MIYGPRYVFKYLLYITLISVETPFLLQRWIKLNRTAQNRRIEGAVLATIQRLYSLLIAFLPISYYSFNSFNNLQIKLCGQLLPRPMFVIILCFIWQVADEFVKRREETEWWVSYWISVAFWWLHFILKKTDIFNLFSTLISQNTCIHQKNIWRIEVSQ